MNSHNRNPLWFKPTVEERLRDPMHPIHHGLVLHPVPNLIVTNGRTRGRIRMSRWMFRTVVFAHYTPLQKFLHESSIVALILILIGLGYVTGA